MNIPIHFDIVAIGNAIVDILVNMDDDFLKKHSMPKGIMTLIDADTAETIYRHLAQKGVECSGGSAANTVVGMAFLGAKPAFIGKVANDKLGEVFGQDLTKSGVFFTTPRLEGGEPTARCMVIVTPDAQRTMNTYLGACSQLSRHDIDEDLIRKSGIVYMEGYLWDRPEAKEALTYAAELAHKYDRKASLTLSDAFCVNRHRDSFFKLISDGVDILFCNEDEINSLFNSTDSEESFKKCRDLCEIVVVTRGEKGAVAVCGKDRYEVPAAPIDRVIDTTGAGDAFAAGFLTGLTRQKNVPDCLQMGALAAAEIISHYGARPETSINELIDGEIG